MPTFRWGPTLFLLVGSPLIAEVFVSHNSPLEGFLQPQTWFFMILSYGIPILFIREIWKRMGLSIVAVPIFGIAYGILNEGVIAQTLTQTAGEPAGGFIGYGTVVGIHLTWVLYILTWHAIFSVLAPILLTQALFPSEADRPWLGNTAFVLCGILTIAQYGLYFLGGLVPTAHSLSLLLIYLGATAILAMLALWVGRRLAPRRAEESPRSLWRTLLLIVSGAFVPNVFYFLAYVALGMQLQAWLFLLIGTGAFVWLLAFVRSHEGMSFSLFAFSMSASIGFSLMAAFFGGGDISLVLPSIVYLVFGGFMLAKAAGRLTRQHDDTRMGSIVDVRTKLK